MMPPPQESSCRPSLAKRAVWADSFARKPSSPSAAKMSGMLRPSALTISSSRSMNFLPSFSANARPTVDFPLEGIPMRATLSISRRSAAVMRPISPAASSNFRLRKYSAAYTACATSISRPPTATGVPASSARRMSSVLSGLYTTSSTASSPGIFATSRLHTPTLGYIPAGVVLMTICAPLNTASS